MFTSRAEADMGEERGCGAEVFSALEWEDLARQLRLSGRELQIVQCIFADQKEAAIARSLGMSPHTVHTHLGRLYRKLSTSSRCGVILRVFAVHMGVLPETAAAEQRAACVNA